MSEQGNQNRNRKKNIKDHIKVAIRCRPLLQNEKALCEIVCNARKNQIGVVLPRSRGRESNKLYTLDKIYEGDTSQHHVFTDSIKPIISDVLCGYNCTVFAYGQTGSGKTYTMEGAGFDSNCYKMDNQHDGIIPRAIKSIFHEIEEEQIESTVIVSHLEIYNEELRDLLSESDDDDTKKKLIIYNDTKKKCHGVFVQGLEEIIVSSPQQIFNILSKSTEKRQTAATNLNQRSSRSHCIFTITIRIKKVIGTEEIVKTGTLNLVDLAGSESIARSGAEHNRAKEAGHINTSLLTLGRVISALVERRQHIPYRESKLTRLLQESLGGRNKTLLIATISSASPLEQTLSTLDYALRAKNIENKPTLNVSMTKEKYVKELQVLILNYRKQIDALRNEKGVYLPTLQYENMTDKIEAQRTQIESMSTLFEAEKEKIVQINALFTRTSEELKDTRTKRDELMNELHEISLLLKDAQVKLAQYVFVVDKYDRNEKELRSQAVNVRDSLQNTIKERDVLHEKTDKIEEIQDKNISNWEQKKVQIMRRMSSIKENVIAYKTDLNQQMMKHKECTQHAEDDIVSILSMIQEVSEEHQNVDKLCSEAKELNCQYIEKQLNEQLTECMQQTHREYNELHAKCSYISTKAVPNIMQEMHSKVVSLQSEVNKLNANVQNMHFLQKKQSTTFVEQLNDCIVSIVTQMNENDEQEIEALHGWKTSQAQITNECKSFVMNEMKKVLTKMCAKQISAFDEQCNKFKNKQKVSNDAIVTNMRTVINEYEMNDDKEYYESSQYLQYKTDVDDLHENIENISNNIKVDCCNDIKSEICNLSQRIQTSQASHTDFMQNTICVNVDDFMTERNKYEDALIECKKARNNKIAETKKALVDHKTYIHQFINKSDDYTINAPFIKKICADLQVVHKESESHSLFEYKKTGATPGKHRVSFPKEFVRMKPFDELVMEFNNENSISGSRSRSRSLSRSRSQILANEVEINFTEKELGFRMYAGDDNISCFIRHCSSDPRVADDAQIISIDGIDVITKSVGYIRTLLATKQRPISIKFKNNICNITNRRKRRRDSCQQEEEEPKRKRHKNSDGTACDVR